MRKLFSTVLLVGISFQAAMAQTRAPDVAREDVGRFVSPGQLALNPQSMAENLSRIKFDAQRGNASAQYQLGLVYEWGIGVYKNIREAAAWYDKAARGGNPWAMVSLGSLLINGYTDEIGKKVEADPVRAYVLFSQAAAAGVHEGSANLALMYLTGSPENKIEPDLKIAEGLLWKVSDAGNPRGPVLLAYAWLTPLLDQILKLNESRKEDDPNPIKLPELTERDVSALAMAAVVAEAFKKVPGAGVDRLTELPAMAQLMQKAQLDEEDAQEQIRQTSQELLFAYRKDPRSFRKASSHLHDAPVFHSGSTDRPKNESASKETSD